MSNLRLITIFHKCKKIFPLQAIQKPKVYAQSKDYLSQEGKIWSVN